MQKNLTERSKKQLRSDKCKKLDIYKNKARKNKDIEHTAFNKEYEDTSEEDS